jgi:hypothetical protein
MREADGRCLEIARYSDAGPCARSAFVFAVDKVLDVAGKP